MATLREAKSLGVIGSILIIAGAPQGTLSIILPIIGLTLLLLSVHDIGKITGDRELFTNMMTFVGLSVIGVLVGFVIVFPGIVSLLTTLSSNVTNPPSRLYSTIYDQVAAIILGLIVIWILAVIGAIFLRRCYDSMATNLKTDLFYTTGKLFLIGAVLTIVVGIGLVIILVALALQAAAFLALPDEVPPRTHMDPWGRPLPPNLR